MRIEVIVQEQEAMSTKGDVLALKFAQSLHGLDAAVVARFRENQYDITGQLPDRGEVLLAESRGLLPTNMVLFVGVDYLFQFGYEQIRGFARSVLSSLSALAPDVKTLVVTLHGAGYGLDEVEAFEAEIAGFMDAVANGTYPDSLRRIVFAEKDARRARLLNFVVPQVLPLGGILLEDSFGHDVIPTETFERLRHAGYSSLSKPHVFVAMPFTADLDDVYHYAIQAPIHSIGLLCERADTTSYTGDVVTWIRERIETASVVVADLSRPNPNVYLEVGYAWGRNTPTILLTNDETTLQFDVRGHRCLVYNSIRDLEKRMSRELKRLARSTTSAVPNPR